jgi:hypothetical protein
MRPVLLCSKKVMNTIQPTKVHRLAMIVGSERWSQITEPAIIGGSAMASD